jgi:glutamine synthetase
MGRFAVAGLRDPCFDQVYEVVDALTESGTQIGAFQTEGERGQFEISLEPKSPIRAIDELIFVHDTIKTVYARHGLVATMSPRPVVHDKQAAGQHTHVSINPPEMEDSFLAGIMSNLPALSALCLPYDLSYERMQSWQAGHVVAWGTENRAVPVRRIKAGHWELRFVDATANMYLALAAILSAGLQGCLSKTALTWPDSGLTAEQFPPDAKPMPRNMDESLDALEKACDELQGLTESRIISHYIQVKRFEAARMRHMAQDAVRDLLSEVF